MDSKALGEGSSALLKKIPFVGWQVGPTMFEPWLHQDRFCGLQDLWNLSGAESHEWVQVPSATRNSRVFEQPGACLAWLDLCVFDLLCSCLFCFVCVCWSSVASSFLEFEKQSHHFLKEHVCQVNSLEWFRGPEGNATIRINSFPTGEQRFMARLTMYRPQD